VPRTGLSDFPHLTENHVTVLDVARVVIAPSSTQPLTFPALTPMRLSEPFEALRDASDPALKKTGSRPKIFLANLGNPVDFIARSMFARNFFEAGGIEAVEFSGGDLAAAFNASGASLVCLCSSDEVYAIEAAAAAQALTAAGAGHIYLAGRPGDLAGALKQAGVQTYVFAGCDVLATLQAAHEALRKAP
jgi:methylmalonyl-CoA mutase